MWRGILKGQTAPHTFTGEGGSCCITERCKGTGRQAGCGEEIPETFLR